jgi:hypothetical protein
MPRLRSVYDDGPRRPRSDRGESLAHVFISYERSTEATARDVIQLLKRSGHETWSHALIPPHRDYADVIQEHLETADVVLVLWSAAAAISQWVRAEADHAREHGKLVQVVLDSTIPPMPFNRIQCARLSTWNGDPNDAEWRKVLSSLEQVARRDSSVSRRDTPVAPAPSSALHAPRRPDRSRRLLADERPLAGFLR